MFEASVTSKVLDLTTVPVEVIVGDAVSKLERFGIPSASVPGWARWRCSPSTSVIQRVAFCGP